MWRLGSLGLEIAWPDIVGSEKVGAGKLCWDTVVAEDIDMQEFGMSGCDILNYGHRLAGV